MASESAIPEALLQRYGPDYHRSYFADLARARLWGVAIAELPLAEAKDAYVRGDIELAEFEQRIDEFLCA